jgi:transketolase
VVRSCDCEASLWDFSRLTWERDANDADNTDNTKVTGMIENPHLLAERANALRRRDLLMLNRARLGHTGGDFSAADILTTLYLAVLNIDPARPDWPDRDRFILSKGHASGMLYNVLAEAGFFPLEELATFAQPESRLNGHPANTKLPGVETSTGPLGHGLPVAVGAALGAKLDAAPWRTFVLTGDGELQEGSNWEAAMAAGHFRLDNLTWIVDRNGLQQGAATEQTIRLEPLADKLRAFGWAVREVDGHDHAALLATFRALPFEPGKPNGIIARTHKGKGVSFIQDRAEWHHHHRALSEAEVAAALAELGSQEAGVRDQEAGVRSQESGGRGRESRGTDHERAQPVPMDSADIGPVRFTLAAQSILSGTERLLSEGHVVCGRSRRMRSEVEGRGIPIAATRPSTAVSEQMLTSAQGASLTCTPELRYADISRRFQSQAGDCRDAFAAALEALARADRRIVAVCNDSISSSKLGGFAREFPDRLVNVGIAEQNMIGVAAGLANAGKIPFACGASCFLTGRALEQIKADLAYSHANVKLCGMSSGVAYGELGATHHSIEDLAWTRAIAGMTVIVPADLNETAQAVEAAAALRGPVFLRLSRMPVPAVYGADYRFVIGRAARLRAGEDVTIIAAGTLVGRALAAADLLAQDGVSARVLNMATVRPIDRDAIIAAARETRGIVTVEEHTIFGGLGSAVAEVVVTTHPAPMRILGFPGVFAPTGSAAWLFEHFGLTPEGIRAAAREVVDSTSRVSAAG